LATLYVSSDKGRTRKWVTREGFLRGKPGPYCHQEREKLKKPAEEIWGTGNSGESAVSKSTKKSKGKEAKIKNKVKANRGGGIVNTEPWGRRRWGSFGR